MSIIELEQFCVSLKTGLNTNVTILSKDLANVVQEIKIIKQQITAIKKNYNTISANAQIIKKKNIKEIPKLITPVLNPPKRITRITGRKKKNVSKIN